MPLSEVVQLALQVLHPQELLTTILNQLARPPPMPVTNH
jgi:hypothetical protein